MSKTFFIGDTHFFDQDIINYTKNARENMVSKWNEVVGKDDIVYHLGDVIGANRYFTEENIRVLIQELKGRKYLIMGNHDKVFSPKQWMEFGFEMAYDHPIIVNKFVILCHEPLWINNKMPYIMGYAHVHDNPIYNTFTDRTRCFSIERLRDNAPMEWDLYNDIKREFISFV